MASSQVMLRDLLWQTKEYPALCAYHLKGRFCGSLCSLDDSKISSMASVASINSNAVMYHGNLCRRITALVADALAALRDSRRNLIGLEQMQKELKAAIEREQKQFDCLQVFYKKA